MADSRTPLAYGGQNHSNSGHPTPRYELVGCIIGRGGSKINMIRQETKAFIKIADAEEGNALRRITIKGTPNSVQLAIFYINYTVTLHQQIVEMNLAIDIAAQTESRGRELRD